MLSRWMKHLSQLHMLNMHNYFPIFNSRVFFKDFIYLFLKRGREGEREGEKYQCLTPTGYVP